MCPSSMSYVRSSPCVLHVWAGFMNRPGSWVTSIIKLYCLKFPRTQKNAITTKCGNTLTVFSRYLAIVLSSTSLFHDVSKVSDMCYDWSVLAAWPVRRIRIQLSLIFSGRISCDYKNVVCPCGYSVFPPCVGMEISQCLGGRESTDPKESGYSGTK